MDTKQLYGYVGSNEDGTIYWKVLYGPSDLGDMFKQLPCYQAKLEWEWTWLSRNFILVHPIFYGQEILNP